jgi:membrane-associated phospholipid phosphatase
MSKVRTLPDADRVSQWARRPLIPPAARPVAGALLTCCVAVTAVLGALFAHQTHAGWLDRAVDVKIAAILGAHPGASETLAYLGAPVPVTALTVALLVACLIRRRWSACVLLAVAVPGAIALTELVLKHVVGRKYGGSLTLPSGHTTGAFAVAAAIAVLLADPGQARLRPAVRALFALMALLVAAAVGIGVIALDFHYFTDTVAGAAVGTGSVIATAFVVDHFGRLAQRARIRKTIAGASPGMTTARAAVISPVRPRRLIARLVGADQASLIQKYDAAMAEPDEVTAVQALPPVRPMLAGGPRRVRWPVALALVWATLAVADIVAFHSGLDSRPASAAKQAATPRMIAPGHTGARAPLHQPTIAHSARASGRPIAPARVLVPISASAFGPTGQGDNPQNAAKAIDPSTSTCWVTDWYRTAHFGGLQAGTGLLIGMSHPARITRVRILLGSARDADLQLRTGNVPVLAGLRLQASASDAGGTLRLKLARPERARYLLIWFTLLPPDSSGTFQASVCNVRLEGGR